MIKAMRSGFLLGLMVVLVFAGGYFYNFAMAVCPIPIEYRIGVLDDRFDLTEDEAKVAVAAAAEVWEEATGQNLFIYDEHAEFPVNFIFDERQAFRNEEERLRSQLDTASEVNDAITSTYENLKTEYQRLSQQFQSQIAAYDKRLADYNATVDEYNQQGGAPQSVYEELKEEKEALDDERERLKRVDQQLDEMVEKINGLGEQGNALIENYNENVGEFNDRYGELPEFTQGDYGNGRINIYTYKDLEELHTVLVHEFGHALSLDHVEGEASVMYYLIGGQPDELKLSAADLAEFDRVCGSMNLWDKIMYRLTNN